MLQTVLTLVSKAKIIVLGDICDVGDLLDKRACLILILVISLATESIDKNSLGATWGCTFDLGRLSLVLLGCDDLLLLLLRGATWLAESVVVEVVREVLLATSFQFLVQPLQVETDGDLTLDYLPASDL